MTTDVIYVKNIAFDWGNTIAFDPRYKIFPIIANEIVKIFRVHYGKNLSAEEVEKKYFEIDTHPRNSWVGATHFGQEDPIIGDLLIELGMPHGDSAIYAPDVLSVYRRLWKDFTKNSPHNAEVKDTLDYLKREGFYISLMSNERKHTLRAALDWSGIFNYFDYIATAHEYGMEKHPNKPESRERFLKETGFNPDETVYVGDDPIRDIKWAKDGGMKAILFVPPEEFVRELNIPWRSTKIEVEPDLIIHKFSELKDKIKKL